MIPLNEISHKVSYYRKDDGNTLFIKKEKDLYRYVRANSKISREEVADIFNSHPVEEGRYSPFFSARNNKLESMMMQTKDLYGARYDHSIIQRMDMNDFKKQIVNVESLEKQIPHTLYTQDGISFDMIRSYNFMSFLVTYEIRPRYIRDNIVFTLNYENHICLQKDISLLYAILNNYDKHQLCLFCVMVSTYKDRKRYKRFFESTRSGHLISDQTSFQKTQIM